MPEENLDRRAVWKTIFLFMAFLVGLSALAHFAIVKLNPTSIYVGALMWCPALAAMLTLRLTGRPLSSLPWQWGAWKYNRNAYLVPVFYVFVAYALIWGFGLGGFPNAETIADWAQTLGLEGSNNAVVLTMMILLLGLIGFVKSFGTIFGEELGWRGFFIWELRKVMPFGAVAIFSGLVWAIWHWPVVVYVVAYYSGGDALMMVTNFTIMIVGMSVIMAYFTFKSESLWPAVIFHAAHNIYIQKIFSPLTVKTENTVLWIDEYGMMIPIITTLMAIYFWRKAKTEGL